MINENYTVTVEERLANMEYYKRKIHIQILHECNLNCYNCFACCNTEQAPSKDKMTMEQIDHFIKEVIELDIKWKDIVLTGGEPFLLDNIHTILKKVYDFAESIEITSNGTVRKSLINMLGRICYVSNTNKKGRAQQHLKIHNAPIDFPNYDSIKHLIKEDCNAQLRCGLGLNRYGYYPCFCGGSIDRVLGFNIGIKTLKEALKDENIQKQKDILCPYCGLLGDLFTTPRFELECLDRDYQSKSWIDAFKRYKESPPTLTLY